MSRCKACGAPLFIISKDSFYCQICKVKRHRNPPEIDPENGEWEGITHD